MAERTALFVDCDDTLVIWLDEYDQPKDGQNPYGGGSQRWRANVPLIEAITRWMDEDKHLEVIVWSGGGHDYARVWRDRLFHASYTRRMHALAKDIRLPRDNDICIDDQDLNVPCALHTADEFIELL